MWLAVTMHRTSPGPDMESGDVVWVMSPQMLLGASRSVLPRSFALTNISVHFIACSLFSKYQLLRSLSIRFCLPDTLAPARAWEDAIRPVGGLMRNQRPGLPGITNISQAGCLSYMNAAGCRVTFTCRVPQTIRPCQHGPPCGVLQDDQSVIKGKVANNKEGLFF